MSSSDHPEPGLLKPNVGHDSEATAASPQNSQLPPPAATEKSSALAEPSVVAEPQPTVVQADNVPLGDAAPVHSATGGDIVVPVTATATVTTTTSPATTETKDENVNAVSQSRDPLESPMAVDESKTGMEVSSDQSEDVSGKEAESSGPSLDITLLLTTGSRHPFTIDGKYLQKRSVNVENYDPFAMSVYTLKELIWREWRSGESTLGWITVIEMRYWSRIDLI